MEPRVERKKGLPAGPSADERAALLASIVDSSNDAIIATTPDGVITSWNRGAEHIFGYSADEILGRPISAVIHSARRTEMDKILLRIRNGERVEPYETTLVRKNGKEIAVSVAVSPIRDHADALVGVALIARMARSDKFRAILEAAPDAMVVVNKQGLVQLVNAQTEKLFGYARNELLGQKVEILIPERFGRKHPGYRDQFFAEPHFRGMGLGLELYGCRKDGSEFPIEVSLSPLETPEGILVASTIRDITERKRADAKLLGASQYARSLIEASLDPLVTISPEGKITDVNEGSIKVTGVPREKLIGTDFSNYFTEPEKAREGYRQAFSEGSVTDYPLTIRHRDGAHTHVLYNATVYKDALGNVLGVFAAARDVTQQKQASQYARSLIEASVDPLVTISADGKITDVNEATIKVTGVSREGLIGTDFTDYFTEPHKAREGYQRVFSEGFVSDYPLTIRHKDGKLTEVLYNASVYKDPQGHVLGVFAAARDVTQQKKAGEERSRLAAIVDSTMDAIIGKSIEGVVTSWNKGAERMFGYAAAEIIDHHVSELIPPHLRDEEQRILEKLGRGERVAPYETQRRRKTGEVFDVSLTVSPVQDANGRIVGASKIARDITAQKQASQYARSLIEASLDPLVTISPEGKITDVNEGSIKVTGVPREKLIGTDFSNYFTEPEKAREGYQQVFSKGFVTDYPLTIRHRDGAHTHVLYNASVYKDVRGSVLGVFAAARDVTAQKRAEAEVADQRTKELERLAELERFQKLTVGRELKMIELKKEIEDLKKLVPADRLTR